jgi:hypothetical protein
LVDWFQDQVGLTWQTPREILEFCLLKFESRFEKVDELMSQEALVEDCAKMRIQPAVMGNYRRFVILKAKDDPTQREFHEVSAV